MNKYYIMDEDEYLCHTNEPLTDKDRNKKRGLTYWSKFEGSYNERIRFNFIRALSERLMIFIFANDIKAKIINCNQLKEEVEEK